MNETPVPPDDSPPRGSARLQAAILSVSLVILSANTISPIVGELQDHFPAIATMRLRSLVTVTAISTTVCILASGLLSGRLGARRVLLAGLAIYTLAGTAPMYLESFTAIYWSRIVLGVGIGLVYPYSVGLIVDFFQGGHRSRLLGWQFSAGNVGLASMLAATGFLTRSPWGWRAAFVVYGIGALVFLAVLTSVPEPPRHPKEKSPKQPGTTAGSAAKVLCVCLCMGIYNMLYLAIFHSLALTIKGAGIGDAGVAGLALTTMTLTTMAAASVFGPLFAKTGWWLGAAAAALQCGGYSLLSLADGLPMVIAAVVCLGAANAFSWPLGNTAMVNVAPRSAVTFCLALLQASMNLGTFLSPFVFGALAAALGRPEGGVTFPLCASAMAVAAIALACLAAARRKKRGGLHATRDRPPHERVN